MIPDTHRVLLKTMLQYEIDNFLRPIISRISEYDSYITPLSNDEKDVVAVYRYLNDRIKELDE